MGRVLGECPKCKATVLSGKYGAFCSGKCGMSLSYAFGKQLEENKIEDLLLWKPIYVRGMKRKDGSIFNAYLRPERVVPYSYIKQSGEKKEGFRYEFSLVDVHD